MEDFRLWDPFRSLSSPISSSLSSPPFVGTKKSLAGGDAEVDADAVADAAAASMRLPDEEMRRIVLEARAGSGQ